MFSTILVLSPPLLRARGSGRLLPLPGTHTAAESIAPGRSHLVSTTALTQIAPSPHDGAPSLHDGTHTDPS